jgi:signal transduction histidine kinase
MLLSVFHEFLAANREEILRRSRAKLTARKVPTPTVAELSDGLPLFLDQLIRILRAQKNERAQDHMSVSSSAALHGHELLRIGLTVGQVVHDYGSICQSVTELADETNISITADEFHTFNRCLDDAIAGAVTTYEHHRDRMVERTGVAHLGLLAHEMRNLLNTSMLTFAALERGSIGVNGSTGTLLGRSLRRMRVLIDRTLAEVRLEAAIQSSERVPVSELLEEIEVVAKLEANSNDIELSIDAGPRGLAVQADHQILAAVVANLVQNAFKFTRPHGRITIRAYTTEQRVRIDVADQCGGLPPGKAEELFRPFERHSVDQSGLGLGLAISWKGIRASGGEIHVRNFPGSGCVFTIDLPSASQAP